MSIFNFKNRKNKEMEKRNESTYGAVEESVEPKPDENAAAEITPKAEDTASKEEKETQPHSRNVYNLIILDESGSMHAIYDPAITGVNETLQTIREARKENPGQNHFVTLVAFDSSHYNEIYHNVPAESALDITKEQYIPSGMTPLYDAMGRALMELREHVKDESDVILVTIVTDGYENFSKEFTGASIKALIEDLKKRNWVFTYIGANQDVESVAASMSINNHYAFMATEEGTNEMFRKERCSRKKFFKKLNKCDYTSLSDEIKDDYFSEF